MSSNAPKSLAELIQTIQDKGLQFWNDHSFRYVAGQITALPTTGAVATSGMATSWATPLAAGMLLRLAAEKSIDIRTENGQKQLRELVQGRIFDPLVHKNY